MSAAQFDHATVSLSSNLLSANLRSLCRDQTTFQFAFAREIYFDSFSSNRVSFCFLMPNVEIENQQKKVIE